MAVPGRIEIGGMAAAVQINLMEAGTFVIGNVNQEVLALYELPQWAVPQRGRWQASGLRAVFGVGSQALLLDGDSLRQKLGLAGINRSGNPPDAGKVGFATVSAGRWPGRRSVALSVGLNPQAILA